MFLHHSAMDGFKITLVAIYMLVNVTAEVTPLVENLQRGAIDFQNDVLETVKGIVCTEVERQLFRDRALISGPDHRVADGALTSSGTYYDRPEYGPRCSRLGLPKPAGCGTSGWAPDVTQPQIWIQVDFETMLTVGGVATQGRDEPPIVNYITSYKLAFYEDENLVFYHETRASEPKVFRGNSDTTSVVRHHLNPPIHAQILRLYVVTSHGHAVFRWELYGYQSIC